MSAPINAEPACLTAGTAETPLTAARMDGADLRFCRREAEGEVCYRLDETAKLVVREPMPAPKAATPTEVVRKNGAVLVWANDGRPVDLDRYDAQSWAVDTFHDKLLVATADTPNVRPQVFEYDLTTHARSDWPPAIGSPCVTLEVRGALRLAHGSDCKDGGRMLYVSSNMSTYDAIEGEGFDADTQVLLLPDALVQRARHGRRVVVKGASIDLGTTFLPGQPIGPADPDDGFVVARPDGDVWVVHGGVSQGTFVRLSPRSDEIVDVVRVACGAPPWTKPEWSLAGAVAQVCADKPLTAEATGHLNDDARTEAGRLALFDAFDACEPLAPKVSPREPATWKELMADRENVLRGQAALGATADRKAYVAGIHGCEPLADVPVEITKRDFSADPSSKGTRISVATAEKIAPPMGWLPSRDVSFGDPDSHGFVSHFRLGAVTFLAFSDCWTMKPEDDHDGCRFLVLARAPGQPPAAIVDFSADMVEWGPWHMDASGTEDGAVLGLELHKGGFEFCQDVMTFAFSVPGSVVSTMNTNALGALREKRFDEAARGFTAALAIDANAELPRYNLACTQALMGKDADAAATLGPLVAADRKKWVAKIKKDPDFDQVRASAAMTALLSE